METELNASSFEDIMEKQSKQPTSRLYHIMTDPDLTWAERTVLSVLTINKLEVPTQTYREAVIARWFDISRHEARYTIGSLVRKGRVAKTSEYGPSGTPEPFYAAILRQDF